MSIAAPFKSKAGAGRGRAEGWAYWFTFTVLAVFAMPFVALLLIAAGPSGNTWTHLIGTVLPGATVTTVVLMAGVGFGTASIGVMTAWLVAMCRFPGRRVFEIALVLPLAVPVYIGAYCTVELLDYSGPLQTALRAVFGFRNARDYPFPEIRSLPGAILAMTMVLFPYVYMTVRVLFLTQSARIVDVSRTLGASPRKLFFRIVLPMARPAIAVGVSLALMEAINDIGSVEFFGVRTLTFAIYETWLNRSDLSGAAQLACVLLVVVFGLIAMERAARGRQRYAVGGGRHPLPAFRLTGWRAALAFLGCLFPVLLGFLMPLWLMASYASRRIEQFAEPALRIALANSVMVAAATAFLTVTIALLLVYAARLSRSPLVAALGRVTASGYAVPGTVLAVGILYPLATLDNTIDATARALFGIGTGLLITGSGGAIVYACIVRFLAIGHGTIEAGTTRITEHLDMAARTLGRTPRQVLWDVHVPLIRPALTTAALLVFVDTMKELSATILLRPFNFETLATFIFAEASRGYFENAAAASLVIVAVGVVPLLILMRVGAAGAGGLADRLQGEPRGITAG